MQLFKNLNQFITKKNSFESEKAYAILHGAGIHLDISSD